MGPVVECNEVTSFKRFIKMQNIYWPNCFNKKYINGNLHRDVKVKQ